MGNTPMAMLLFSQLAGAPPLGKLLPVQCSMLNVQCSMFSPCVRSAPSSFSARNGQGSRTTAVPLRTGCLIGAAGLYVYTKPLS